MRCPPKRTVSPRDTGRPGGVTSGTVPERHREHIPAAGLTGSTRSEPGAHGRSRWGVLPRHGVSLANTADLGVKAWCGGEGSRPPAPQSGWRRSPRAATETEARPGHQDDGHGSGQGAPGHGGQGHRTVWRRPSRGAAASWQRTGAVSGTAPGGDGKQQDQVLTAHGCGVNLQREQRRVNNTRACVLMRDASGPPAGPCQSAVSVACGGLRCNAANAFATGAAQAGRSKNCRLVCR